MYDVIIIGMGISGISAALYAKGANLKVKMFEGRMPGGLLNNIDEVDNYAGFTKIKGPDFAMNLFNQVNEMKIDYENTEVKKIEVDNEIKKVYTNDNVYEAKNIIIATGRSPKPLGLEGEEKFFGKGISYCALCDGNFYKDKTVAVVGGGNSALQETLYLSKIVKKVYMIVRRDRFSGNKELIDEVNALENVEVIFNSQVANLIEEDNKLSSIIITNNKEINISGLFVYIGYIPYNQLVNDLNITDERGYILVNEKFETNISGVYAIGDIIKKELYQLVTAASDGATVISSITKKN